MVSFYRNIIFIRRPNVRSGLFLCMLFFGCLTISQSTFAQNAKDSLCYDCRRAAVIGSTTTVALGSYFFLSELWYTKYEQAPLHSFNDGAEWLQMDKVGHAFSTYTLSDQYFYVLKRNLMDERKAAWLAGGTSFLYLTGVELLDGFSAQWGWSWSDMLANSCGTSLFLLQQLKWNDQRIQLKFSYSNSPYAMFNSEQLGHNFQQRLFKDYNAQTYWLSGNVSSYLASDKVFPRWLNVAIGYGATEMTTARINYSDVNNFNRTREFYLSFDADLKRLRWKRKWVKQTMKILSFIKIPGPTFEMRSDGKIKFHALFF
jgi:uncharacterized protein YfiM (DUF2279 family)